MTSCPGFVPWALEGSVGSWICRGPRGHLPGGEEPPARALEVDLSLGKGSRGLGGEGRAVLKAEVGEARALAAATLSSTSGPPPQPHFLFGFLRLF